MSQSRSNTPAWLMIPTVKSIRSKCPSQKKGLPLNMMESSSKSWNTSAIVSPATRARSISAWTPARSAQGEESRFTWSEYYPLAGVDNFAELGYKTLDKVPLERRNEFFAITLASKEVQL